ncbi:hypothetical protein C8Q78DRAFT_348441 [Trametes maxima]|nr:hypothetical protein C8Q78DRAFT_348441 [Trametes maxima]
MQQPKLVLEFDEPPQVVAVLLRYCYGGHSNAVSFELIAQTLVASQVYAMSGVSSRVRRAWNNEASKYPLRLMCAYTTTIVSASSSSSCHGITPSLREGIPIEAGRQSIHSNICCDLNHHRVRHRDITSRHHVYYSVYWMHLDASMPSSRSPYRS